MACANRFVSKAFAELGAADTARLAPPLRPPGRRSVDLAGHARTVFRRALERGNLLVAEARARELGRLSLVEALELTALIARKEPSRHGRVAMRWLHRYLQERDPTIDELAFVIASLVTLRGLCRMAALTALRNDLDGARTDWPQRLSK